MELCFGRSRLLITANYNLLEKLLTVDNFSTSTDDKKNKQKMSWLKHNSTSGINVGRYF